MQTLHILLKPDRLVLNVCLFMHGMTVLAVLVALWPAYAKGLVFLYLVNSSFRSWQRFNLTHGDSVTSLHISRQQSKLIFRNGKQINVELQASLITGPWVWLQFRNGLLKPRFVLLTQRSTNALTLRRLRVALRG